MTETPQSSHGHVGLATRPLAQILRISETGLASEVASLIMHWPNDVTITDSVGIEGRGVLRLTAPTPVAAQLALGAIAQGRIGAAILSDEVEALPSVLAALDGDVVAVSANLRNKAQEIPPLTARQLDIMHAMSCGASNEQIAEAEALSMSTLKREIRRVRTFLGCKTRTELAKHVTFAFEPSIAH